jgi:tartrate-resistant acid phosphatase type 5
MSDSITRREILRRTVIFSAGALLASRQGFAKSAPPTTKFDGPGIDLLALGDYGTKGNDDQIVVAKGMAKFAKSLDSPLAAVLALGDNFYKPITPDRFENHFEKMYSTDGLNCPFYACLGNHDYGPKYDPQEGKAQIELDYAKNNPRSRWKLPAKWYTFELPSGGKPLVRAIVLDGNYWEGALKPQEKIAQRHFLKAELKKKTEAPWTWVINHFPIFSDGKIRGDNKVLIREWGSILKEYPISLCFGGHDHIMQHVQVKGYQPSFIISGAGGAKLYEIAPTNRGYVSNHHLGFNHIHVTPHEINVQFISAEGNCLHHFSRDQSGRIKVLT